MRIVGGRFKGKRLAAPAGRDVRPTSDRTREAVFNILAHGLDWPGLDGARVVDLFCGTGALGLEALSRGAASVVFVDAAEAAIRAVKGNAGSLGAARDIVTLKLDAAHLPPPPLAAKCPADLVFLDPPYGEDLLEPALLGLAAKGWIVPGSICVCEMDSRARLVPPKGFAVADERTYGKARVVFLRHDG